MLWFSTFFHSSVIYDTVRLLPCPTDLRFWFMQSSVCSCFCYIHNHTTNEWIWKDLSIRWGLTKQFLTFLLTDSVVWITHAHTHTHTHTHSFWRSSPVSFIQATLEPSRCGQPWTGHTGNIKDADTASVIQMDSNTLESFSEELITVCE